MTVLPPDIGVSLLTYMAIAFTFVAGVGVLIVFALYILDISQTECHPSQLSGDRSVSLLFRTYGCLFPPVLLCDGSRGNALQS